MSAVLPDTASGGQSSRHSKCHDGIGMNGGAVDNGKSCTALVKGQDEVSASKYDRLRIIFIEQPLTGLVEDQALGVAHYTGYRLWM